MITKLINRLTKKERIISMVIFIIIVILFVIAWFFYIKKPTYRITFYPENGSRHFSVKTSSNGFIEQPAQPYLDGYEFQYWSQDLINPFDFDMKVTESCKLYAVYLKICNVTFVCDNNVYSTDIVLQGNIVRTPTDPVKTGYSFDYWEYNGSEYNFSNPVNEDLMLLAKFVTRVPCTSVSFSEQTVYVGTEESVFIKTIIEPDNCTDKPVIHLDDKYIADINDDGSIIGINPGQTRISVTCGAYSSEALLICADQVDYIVLDNDQYVIGVGESVALKPTVEPAEASVYRLTYSVADANVAFINDKGIVTGRSGGTTKVTVTSSNGRSTSATVHVNGAYLELSGLPSSFYTTYQPESQKYPVRLIYTEWKNGVKTTDSKCEGALLQCSLDEITYENGYIIQSKPVDFTMSSELYFTFMTSKSNSCFVICEPNVEIQSTENLTLISDTQLKTKANSIASEITMNCSGTWSVLQGSSELQFNSDPVSCSFVSGNTELLFRFITSGGQILDISIIT